MLTWWSDHLAYIGAPRATQRGMTRVVGLLIVLSACSTELADPPAPPPATMRELLEAPTRLQVTAAESGGSITAERKVGTGWDAGLVDLQIENGELILSSDARDALTVDGMQIVFKPLEIPPGVFGDTHAQMTDVRIDLMNETTAPAVWTSDNEAHVTAMLDIKLSWTLSIGGSPAPLGSSPKASLPASSRGRSNPACSPSLPSSPPSACSP